MDCINMTKSELVAAINALPGEKVTTRPRKDTLIEVYLIRKEAEASVLKAANKKKKEVNYLGTAKAETEEKMSLLERFVKKLFG